MTITKPRIGIISGAAAYIDSAGAVWMNHGTARLLNEMNCLDNSYLCVPVVSTKFNYINELVAINKENVVPLPPLVSTIQSQWYFFSARRVIRDLAKKVDVLYMRFPFQLTAALIGLKKPKVIHIVGSPLEVVRCSTDYHGIVRSLAMSYAKYTEYLVRKLLTEPQTRTITHGRELWDRFRCHTGEIVVSSTIKESEIDYQPREMPAIPKILFVGYIRPEKGCGVLLEAFELLREKMPVHLTLLGGADRKTGAESSLIERIAKSKWQRDIALTGMVDFGNVLFSNYKSHDLLVLPTFAEGTPRTLMEARAFGCPVIASNVGGIPESVTNGIDGILIPPGDPRALATAMEKVLTDHDLRAHLVYNGLARAKKNSLESFANSVSQQLLRVLQTQQ